MIHESMLKEDELLGIEDLGEEEMVEEEEEPQAQKISAAFKRGKEWENREIMHCPTCGRKSVQQMRQGPIYKEAGKYWYTVRDSGGRPQNEHGPFDDLEEAMLDLTFFADCLIREGFPLKEDE